MPPSNFFDQAAEAAAYLSARLTIRPAIAVVLGSGLGGFASELGQPTTIPYSEIPHFPQSTVPGHSGQLVAGTLNGVPLVVMQGRVHGYEGYSPDQVVFPVRVLRGLGIGSLVLTNAAGGIRESLKQGQLVLLSDHINFTGKNPVAGANDERLGPRFFDMSEAYSKALREIAQKAADAEGYPLEEGVYLGLLGPSFETPAEIRAFRAMGADLVGMSTVMETIAARQMGVEVLGISCVTNMAAGIQAEPLSHEEVMQTGKQVESTVARLLKRVIPAMAARLDGSSK